MVGGRYPLLLPLRPSAVHGPYSDGVGRGHHNVRSSLPRPYRQDVARASHRHATQRPFQALLLVAGQTAPLAAARYKAQATRTARLVAALARSNAAQSQVVVARGGGAKTGKAAGHPQQVVAPAAGPQYATLADLLSGKRRGGGPKRGDRKEA